MNDPGLDGPLEDIEKSRREHDDEIEAEKEEENMLLDPSRWWFASTASPLIAGTFGPMASAFNICALVEYWRETIPDGNEQTGTPYPDPKWLLAINGVSLAAAVIGNFSLLLNMVGRLSFKRAQPVTIAGFSLAALLLIALIGVASSPLFRINPTSDHALTEAYYFACWAAGLYSIISILMTLTVYGAIADKYPKKFEINDSQRTLMLQTISFMAYLLVGAAIYSSIEGWRFNDAIYWADFTLLTIGLGTPFVPVTHAGRSLIFPYTFGGILAVGLIIGSIRSMLLEKGAQKMHARATEKKRQEIITIHDTDAGKSKRDWLRPWRHRKPRAETWKLPERDRRREEFLAMRHILAHAEKKQRWVALALSTTAGLALWFIGALVFYYTEYEQDWTYFESLYFAYVCLITLGYGDFQPESNSGKAFFVLWSLLAIPALTVLISDMGNTVVKGVSEFTNYVGSLTILAGDADFWAQVRTNVSAVTKGRLFPSQKKEASKRQQEIRKRVEHDEQRRLGKFPDLLYQRLSEQERDAVDDYHHHGPESEHDRDTLFYHFLLVKEVRAVLADARAPSPRTYTYDEWAYFLKLLGQDEESAEMHVKKYNRPKRDSEAAPQVGRILDHEGNPRAWSWLSLRSPLLSQMSEPEWVLMRLLDKLHGEMHFQRRAGSGVGDVRRKERGKDGGASAEKGEKKRPRPPVDVGFLVETWSGAHVVRERERSGSSEEIAPDERDEDDAEDDGTTMGRGSGSDTSGGGGGVLSREEAGGGSKPDKREDEGDGGGNSTGMSGHAEGAGLSSGKSKGKPSAGEHSMGRRGDGDEEPGNPVMGVAGQFER